MCSGHPTGMWESRSPSRFCSMIVPSIGTSIVAFRVAYARLHFHVSDAKRPRTASNSSDGNSGWSFIGSTSSLITASICAVAGTAALEGLGWVGTSYPSVLQRLQTRWGGPTGRLWDWWNLRFCTVCFLLTLHVRTEPLDATPATLEKKKNWRNLRF